MFNFGQVEAARLIVLLTKSLESKPSPRPLALKLPCSDKQDHLLDFCTSSTDTQ